MIDLVLLEFTDDVPWCGLHATDRSTNQHKVFLKFPLWISSLRSSTGIMFFVRQSPSHGAPHAR